MRTLTTSSGVVKSDVSSAPEHAAADVSSHVIGGDGEEDEPPRSSAAITRSEALDYVWKCRSRCVKGHPWEKLSVHVIRWVLSLVAPRLGSSALSSTACLLPYAAMSLSSVAALSAMKRFKPKKRA